MTYQKIGNTSKPVVVVNKISLPVFTILGLIFVVLKLMGIVNWSWWLVTMPFWLGIAVAIGLFLLFWCGILFLALIEAIITRFTGKDF